MLFNSYVFLFCFLPIALFGYFGWNYARKYQMAKVWLIGCSLWFYAYFNTSYLLIILGSMAANYAIYYKIFKLRGTTQSETRNKEEKFWLVSGVGFNLLVLFYFKYYNFFLDNINVLFKMDFVGEKILLPLGISFFTFQQISFIVDTYRGKSEKYSLCDYALFVTFFPQLIAGPIVTHDEILPQFQEETRKRLQPDYMAKGIFVFAIGLFKKVVIADAFGRAVDFGYAGIPSLDSLNAFLVMIFYSIQLYFDFSGYCDMARGLGFLFGIEIPVNFESPYKSANNLELWKRWHITLNRFMTNYVYIPLGGSRKGEIRANINLLCVFLVSGIWHGAAWTYIIWGIMHGVMNILTKLFLPWIKKPPRFLTTAVTYLYFCISIVVFRSQSVAQAEQMLGRLFSFEYNGFSTELAEKVTLDEIWYLWKITGLANLPQSRVLFMLLFTLTMLAILFFGKNARQLTETFQPTTRYATATILLLTWSILSLSGVTTFLYFNF